MGTMKPLASLLETMLQEHERLLTLAKQKKSVLIKGDSDALAALVKEEGECVQTIERLERERIGTARLLAMRLQIEPDLLTASKAIELSDEPAESSRMRDVVNRLADVVDALRECNDTNKRLLEQSLSFIQFSIEVLTESPQVPTYGNTGETHNPYTVGRTSYFDSKA